ncbi:glycosyl hydrolase family 3 C-terminal domain-containing protein [Mycena leptocephala]|nr:glycosyl hydrolase family 3 C-terminal domain-containing protein [Mycena leptocephala]
MVRNGSVPRAEAPVDDMNKGYPQISLKDVVNAQADHYKLVREIGAACTVLLKNTNKALLLAVKNIKRIANVVSNAGPNPTNGCSEHGEFPLPRQPPPNTCPIFVSVDSGKGYINVGGNQGDPNNITLWDGRDALVLVTASSCANAVVVQHTLGPVTVEAWIEHPDITVVLYAGVPGQETGNVIVDVLLQAMNPSGKLPYTIGRVREVCEWGGDAVENL